MPNFNRNEKNRQLMNKFSLSILLFFIINISYGQECQIPNLLDKEIIEASNNEKFVEEDFYRILKEPKGALTKQYEALLASENVELSFNDDALQEIASIAYNVNTEVENIGARRLQTVMSHLLNDLMFDIPDVIAPNAKVVVTKELVKERLGGLVKNRDLSQFIL